MLSLKANATTRSRKEVVRNPVLVTSDNFEVNDVRTLRGLESLLMNKNG
jgi:hypothetical protein